MGGLRCPFFEFSVPPLLKIGQTKSFPLLFFYWCYFLIFFKPSPSFTQSMTQPRKTVSLNAIWWFKVSWWEITEWLKQIALSKPLLKIIHNISYMDPLNHIWNGPSAFTWQHTIPVINFFRYSDNFDPCDWSWEALKCSTGMLTGVSFMMSIFLMHSFPDRRFQT